MWLIQKEANFSIPEIPLITLPKCQTFILIGWDLMDNNISQNVLSHVLDFENIHHWWRQFFLNLYTNVWFQHFAKSFVFIFEKLCEMFIITKRKNVNGLELTLKSNAWCLSSWRFFDWIPFFYLTPGFSFVTNTIWIFYLNSSEGSRGLLSFMCIQVCIEHKCSNARVKKRRWSLILNLWLFLFVEVYSSCLSNASWSKIK